MKKLLTIALTTVVFGAACTTSEETTWEEYTEWRETNNAWLTQQQSRTNPDGTPYFEALVPSWNPSTYVLIHYFNDRAETEGNLSPLYNSVIDVRYKVHMFDDTPVDSSTLQTSYGPGIFRASLNSLVPGWAVALSDMRCGDTVEVVIPYDLAYGSSEMDPIKPYSNLRFNIRLVDIYKYEQTPY